jgi:uncharacterized RDD family membrane protein YckC
LNRAKHIAVILVLVWGALVSASVDTVRDEESLTARRLLAAGSEDMLWLVSSRWNEKEAEFTRRFLYLDAGVDRIRSADVLATAQRMGIVGAAGDTLHVFFQDASHLRLSKSRRWRGHSLPGPRLPLALAGEVLPSGSRLWAVVSPEVATRVEAAWRERQARQTNVSAAGSEPSRASGGLQISSSPRSHRIVLYDGVAWQPGISAPPGYSGTADVWLAVSNGRFHLFWTAHDSPSQIRYAIYADDEWSMGPAIEVSGPVDTAAVSVMNKHLVFAALVKQSDLATVRCTQWSRPAAASLEESWDQSAPLLDESDSELVLARGSAVSLFSDHLVLMRFGETEPELGLWFAGGGGKAERAFEPIPVGTGQEGAASRRSLRDLLATLMIATVLVLLFWKRQETIATPLELPAHLQVAGPARRATAFMIDAAPAALIILWIWYEPITNFYDQIRVAGQGGEPMLSPPAQILWAWFWFRIIYVAYSTGFELATSSTPGKRLMGCHVLSEDLARASFLQIGIRNVARMVELEPFLKIWPFMLIVFFTRNRQRLGDLLARTIMVERQINVLPDQQTGDDPSEAQQ